MGNNRQRKTQGDVAYVSEVCRWTMQKPELMKVAKQQSVHQIFQKENFCQEVTM